MPSILLPHLLAGNCILHEQGASAPWLLCKPLGASPQVWREGRPCDSSSAAAACQLGSFSNSQCVCSPANFKPAGADVLLDGGFDVDGLCATAISCWLCSRAQVSVQACACLSTETSRQPAYAIPLRNPPAQLCHRKQALARKPSFCVLLGQHAAALRTYCRNPGSERACPLQVWVHRQWTHLAAGPVAGPSACWSCIQALVA
jgi:hypothetical protein